ncbi:hypothetical protein Tco_1310726 [Tanacetum coccineum]
MGNATGSRVNKNMGLIQQIRQRLFIVTTVKEKVTWQDSVVNRKGQRIQNSSKRKCWLLKLWKPGLYWMRNRWHFWQMMGVTIAIGQDTQELTTTAIFQTDDLDVFDSNCDEAPSANIDITSDNNVISYDQYLKETKNKVVQDTTSSTQQDAMIMSVIEEMCNQVAKYVLKQEFSKKQDKYIEEIVDLEKKKKALDNIVYKTGQTVQTMHMLTKPQVFYDESHKTALGYQNPLYLTQDQRKQLALYCGHTIVMKHDALSVIDTEETLQLAEEIKLKMLAKQNDPIAKEKKVNIAPIDYATLNKLSKHFVPKKQLSTEQAFWLPISKLNEGTRGIEHIKKAFENDIIPFVKSLRESFTTFDQGLFKEITNMKEVSNQMETKVEKCSIEKKYFEIEKNESLIQNNHLLDHIICQDVMCIAMHADMDNKCVVPANDDNLAYAQMEQSFIDEYSRCLKLEVKLSKKKDMVEKDVYNELSKRSLRLEQHYLEPLYLKLRKNKEAHVDYLKQTKEHADTLCDIVEQARAQQPLDSALEST